MSAGGRGISKHPLATTSRKEKNRLRDLLFEREGPHPKWPGLWRCYYCPDEAPPGCPQETQGFFQKQNLTLDRIITGEEWKELKDEFPQLFPGDGYRDGNGRLACFHHNTSRPRKRGWKQTKKTVEKRALKRRGQKRPPPTEEQVANHLRSVKSDEFRESQRKLSKKKAAEPDNKNYHVGVMANPSVRNTIRIGCEESWADPVKRKRRVARTRNTRRLKRWAKFRADFQTARATGNIEEVLKVANRWRQIDKQRRYNQTRPSKAKYNRRRGKQP